MNSTKTEPVKIYIDGSCKGNPGPAGSACILIYKDKIKKISKFLGNATNNIAELTALYLGLSALKKKDIPVEIYCDSNYVINIFEGKYKIKKNVTLIQKIYKLFSQFKNIKFIKVAAHSGDYYNELVDKLAKKVIEENIGTKGKKVKK